MSNPDDIFNEASPVATPDAATLELRALATAADRAFGKVLPAVPHDVRFEGRRGRAGVIIRLGEAARDLSGIATVPSSYTLGDIRAAARRGEALGREEHSAEAEIACRALVRWADGAIQDGIEAGVRAYAADFRARLAEDDRRRAAGEVLGGSYYDFKRRQAKEQRR